MATTAEITGSWTIRARAYRELVRQQPILLTFAERLVDALPTDLAGWSIDIGGGTGLSTSAFLDRRPNAKMVVLEPSPMMRDLAHVELARYGDRVQIISGIATKVPERSFNGAISSLVMHIVEFDETLRSVGTAIARGALFSFNLWGHSVAAAAKDTDPTDLWHAALTTALREAAMQSRPRGTPAELTRHSRESVELSARNAGLELVSFDLDLDAMPVTFFLDFAAMSPAFLGKLEPQARLSVLARTREILRGETIPQHTARVVLARR